MSWPNAQAEAQSRQWRDNNGYLATLTSPEESRCVSQLFMRQEDRNNGADMEWLWGQWYPARWVGGSDSAQHGTWRWMTGPEAGEDFFSGNHTAFNNWHQNHCCPASNPTDWDYIRLSYPLGTFDYRDTWIPMPSGLPLGALVEYNSAGGETARTYTTTTDSQGNYMFDGLAPGVYMLRRTANGSAIQERVVIHQEQLDVNLDLRGTSITPTRTMTHTPIRALKQDSSSTPTVTPTP